MLSLLSLINTIATSFTAQVINSNAKQHVHVGPPALHNKSASTCSTIVSEKSPREFSKQLYD